MCCYQSSTTIYRLPFAAVKTSASYNAKNNKSLNDVLVQAFLFLKAYSGLGAPTGQTSAQFPQSMHLSASIT